jgi:uncharacterized membrane protein YgcG
MTSTTMKFGTAAALGLGVMAALLPGQPAQACGGFFCNQPQNPFDPPPVAQTGENVLFAMQSDPQTGANHLEAHVQIYYTGPADKFSWVVPVDSEPTLDVGTNQLFKVLEPATRPSFTVNTQEEGNCRVDPRPNIGGAGGDGGRSGTGGSGGGFGYADAGAAPGVDISFRGDIGPYDSVVIRSTDPNDPKPLKDWLQQNKYYLSPEGSGLIDDYVKEMKYFVAIRLINGHTVNEIQPLVMRFDGPGPCVPLRLTAIAAINDLRINLWVLADNRVVPQNYYEIKINPARIDWFNAGSNYDDLVKQAANEAGGNAFVVDSVGDASQLQNSIYTGNFDINRVALAANPADAMQVINNQGYPRDATLLEILRKWIPEPQGLKDMGIPETTFYNQLSIYWQQSRELFGKFEPQKLAADLNQKIVMPLANAQGLFNRFPKLTRLSTFISPDEMTSDPLFITNSTLPPVPAQRVANAYLLCGQRKFSRCEAPIRLELPDGQKLYFKPRKSQGPCYGDEGISGVDRKLLDTAPALEIAYARTTQGEGAVRANNKAAIDTSIDAQNVAARAMIPAGTEDPHPPMGGSGGKGGSSGNGGTAGSMDTGGAGGSTPKSSGGLFGCAMAGSDEGELVVVLVAGITALLVSRRRRRV